MLKISTLRWRILDNWGLECFATPNLREYVGLNWITKHLTQFARNKVYFPAVYPLFRNFVLAKFESATTPKKRGAKPLHFRRLFSTFVGNILNYGSVTLFSCGERRKFPSTIERISGIALPSYLHDTGAGLLLILSIGFPTTCRTKISHQPCAFFYY